MIGTPTQVCVWFCPNISVPAGRPFRCVSDIWLLISGDAKVCQINGICMVLEEQRCNRMKLVYDLVSCAMNGIVASRVSATYGCDRLVSEPEDPYEAIRQDYLRGTDTESEPFEVEAKTPESPHILAPPTCHVEESKGSCTSGVRSTTARMAVPIPPVMSHGLSAGIAVVETMSDSAFCKSVSEDEGPAAGDEGLPTGDEGPDMRVKSCGLNDEGHRVESDGLGLGEEEEAVHEGQQQAALVVGKTVSSPLGLGYRELRHREYGLYLNVQKAPKTGQYLHKIRRPKEKPDQETSFQQ
nr:hypothetical protein [Tanacetum cinerariifolium]